jgi:hypothetical protein
MKLTITFKREDLPKLAPEGATVEQTWVVCFAHRSTVKVNGVEALAGVDAWHPMVPMPSYDAAMEWAEEWVGDAGADRFSWSPVFDDQGNATDADELFIVLDADADDDEDAGSEQADIAIVPLTMLAKGAA